MDISNIDVEQLDNLRIHELRDVARELGVKSPTSLTKNKIIEEVKLIVSGEKDPYFNVRKQGRPTKSETMDLSNFVNATSMDAHLKPFSSGETIQHSYVLKCNEFEFTKSLPTDRVIIGYVEVVQEGYGFIRRTDYIPRPLDTFVSASMIEKYNLCTGMYVRGVERFVANGKPYALVAIESRQVFRETFEEKGGLPLGDKINSYLKLDVLRGGRYLIKNDNPKDLFLNAFSIAESIDKNNEDLKVRLLYVHTVPERLPANLDRHKYDILNLPLNMSDRDMCIAISLYIAKIKLESLENDVVLIVTGLTDIAKAYNNVLNDENSNKINLYTASKVNDILACAKNLAKSPYSSTLICLDNMKMSDEMKRMFENDILDNFCN